MQLENTNKTKKDYENRTRIDRMVQIYVLDFRPELVNMVVQGFTKAHGTKVLPSNLTNKESIIICGKGPYL